MECTSLSLYGPHLLRLRNHPFREALLDPHNFTSPNFIDIEALSHLFFDVSVSLPWDQPFPLCFIVDVEYDL